MRIIFMGSPAFAVPTLRRLDQHYQVLAVVTQPDRHAGRGRKIQAPPVKLTAQELDIPVYQPTKIGDQSTLTFIQDATPDFLIVAAYGKILPEELLNIPQVSSVNVHASLLPRWRGAAPIQAAIRSGDKVTGVSVMQMDAGLDTGPVYAQSTIDINPVETSGQLSERLAELGSELIVETLPAIHSGRLQPSPQDDSQATYAPMLKKTDGHLNFEESAEALARQVRAFEPWPTSYFYWNNKRIVVRAVEAVEIEGQRPGECQVYNHMPAVSANPGLLVIHQLQPAGKKTMAGNTFLNGVKDFPNGRITDAPSP